MFAHPAFNLDWNLVRTFVAVANGGSLAAGARTLGITHPTAARHIQLLEEGLGVALFTRSGKGLVLNDMGEALQSSAAEMHSSAVSFQSRIDQLKATPVQLVRVAVAEMLAELLPELMITELNPCKNDGLSVDLLVSNDLINLLQRDADIAVRHVRPEQQELLCKRVGTLKMGAYASREYVQRRGCLSRATFAKHKFIEGLSKDYLTQGARQRGIEIDPGQVSFKSDSLACQRAAVSAGWGVAVLPQWTKQQEPEWVQVFENEDLVEIDVWLVARPEVRDNKSLRAVFSGLGEALQTHLNHE